MSGKQRAVLWIGLILIAFNIVRKWSEISSIIFAGAGGPIGSGSTPSGGQSGGGNSVTVPIDPFLPTGPKITIPIPKL
jgi:hypothetical protein